MAFDVWGWFGNRSSGEGQEFETPASEKNWGWFGNRSSGEGIEFEVAATAWSEHAWLRGGQMIQAAEAGGGAVSSTLAFTTEDITFAGTATETITSSLAFTTDDVTFSGTATETISSTLAFTTEDIAFDGIATETITSTLAFTTDDIQFDGIANVVTNDVTSTLEFTTDDIGFDGNAAVSIEELIFGGSGYPVYGKYERPKGIGEFLDIAMADIYEAVVEEERPIETKEAFAKVVKPYVSKKSKSKIPDVDSIDWIALEQDVARVEMLMELWQQILDDEEVIIMAYLEYYH